MSSGPAKSDGDGDGDGGGEVEIREVWADNLDAEFAMIREVVDEYPFIAMDTEFPGVVIQPLAATDRSNPEGNYLTLRTNVDLLHLIQLGLTFCNAAGELPPAPSGGRRRCVWQFNFREFDLERDFYHPDSIDLLVSCGIDFARNRERGVDACRFAELLMSSGAVLNDCTTWVTFHCPYDFGYLVKILTCSPLPETQEGFLELIRVFFPNMYDIKHLARFCDGLHGGLNRIAELLGVKRDGVSHQAGSDSLVTARVFWKLKSDYFGGSPERRSGVLFGLGPDYATSNQKDVSNK